MVCSQLTEAEWQSFVESQMVDIPTEIRLVLAEYRVVPFTTLSTLSCMPDVRTDSRWRTAASCRSRALLCSAALRCAALRAFVAQCLSCYVWLCYRRCCRAHTSTRAKCTHCPRYCGMRKHTLSFLFHPSHGLRRERELCCVGVLGTLSGAGRLVQSQPAL